MQTNFLKGYKQVHTIFQLTLALFNNKKKYVQLN